jgi:hypothetical protein
MKRNERPIPRVKFYRSKGGAENTGDVKAPKEGSKHEESKHAPESTLPKRQGHLDVFTLHL